MSLAGLLPSLVQQYPSRVSHQERDSAGKGESTRNDSRALQILDTFPLMNLCVFTDNFK